MKKSVLSALLLGSVALVNAQSNIRLYQQDAFLSKKISTNEPKGTPHTQAPATTSSSSNGAGRAISSVTLGTSGNLYTAINDGLNQVYADDSIGSVVFIHRGANTGLTAPHMGQLVVDVSKDRGNTFNLNIGPLNPKAIYAGTPSSRFPQVVIHRPNNTLIADSAYAVYSSAWLDYTSAGGSGEDWEGEYHGVGRLDGNPATFTDSAEVVGEVALVGENLCKAGNNTGVFYTLNINYNKYTNSSGSNNIASDTLNIGRGVWNSVTKNVDWKFTPLKVTPAFFESTSGDSSSLFSDFDIAFDPTGQIGWIALNGDFAQDEDYTINPVFYKTTDGGLTWSAALPVDLKDVQTIVANLNPDLSGVPTATGNADLAVDANGNPHYLLTVLSAAVIDQNGDPLAYNTYPNGGAAIYDLTFDPTAGTGCAWRGLLVTDSIVSINAGVVAQGTTPADEISLTNRLSISTNLTHDKMFYFWLDTDPISGLNPASNNFFYNINPNFFGKGYDLTSGKFTAIKNFTEGDTKFGGNGVGSFGGTMFPVVSPSLFESAGTYNVPLVAAEIDYQASPGNTKSGQNPARFHYIKNINFTNSEFTQNIVDNLPPIVTIIGKPVEVVYLGTAYVDSGATAFDCKDGNIIPTTSSTVDVNTPGEYTVTYIGTDLDGNSDTVERSVIVGRSPIAQFTYTSTNITNGKRFTFADKSLYNPTTWAWTFGTGAQPTSSASQSSSANYYANGSRQVKLVVTNQFGTDDTIVTINVALGMEDVAFSSAINLYPNPASNMVNLNFSTEKGGTFGISVLNMLGEVAIAERKVEISGSKTVALDVAGLSSGLYIVKVQDNNRVGIKTFTINR